MQKVKEKTRKTRPVSFCERLEVLNSYMKGWIGYLRYTNMQGKLQELGVWIRNRLRYCIWKHWKNLAKQFQPKLSGTNEVK